jgi:hypothetical protein
MREKGPAEPANAQTQTGARPHPYKSNLGSPFRASGAARLVTMGSAGPAVRVSGDPSGRTSAPIRPHAVHTIRGQVPPAERTRYSAFVDPSGGSSDSFTLAIAHRDRALDRFVLDALRERRPPFNPDDCVQEFTALLKDYGITRVHGDHYAGSWPVAAFAKC